MCTPPGPSPPSSSRCSPWAARPSATLVPHRSTRRHGPGPSLGHTTSLDQVRRGRSRNGRPLLGGHPTGGGHGSRADDVPTPGLRVATGTSGPPSSSRGRPSKVLPDRCSGPIRDHDAVGHPPDVPVLVQSLRGPSISRHTLARGHSPPTS